MFSSTPPQPLLLILVCAKQYSISLYLLSKHASFLLISKVLIVFFAEISQKNLVFVVLRL